ncbi:circadian clock KaiB family protein [Egbenema bharatensis]|uniref:circadian clock KaiB family protein n=1 Tax=Egbenema bharatensis TaxID=3463334 RepID=UPI003A8C1167
MSANSNLNTQHQNLFKGIALFTPGGDLVYCIDPEKQSRWHLQLCAVLQEMLNLPEPPHFLVPCYTATIDRCLDARTQTIQTYAEAHPLVLRYQPLLNVIFGVGELVWKASPCPEGICDPIVLSSYQQQFPQLWQDHDLVVRYERAALQSPIRQPQESSMLAWSPVHSTQATQGYVLRLFVAGNSTTTANILANLHRLLEQSLQQPYTLKVIDIHKHPELAEADQVAATPTLVKVWPHPIKRIVGDLEDVHKVSQALALPESFNLLDGG